MNPSRTLTVAVLAMVILSSSPSAAQSLVGALAIDERRGDEWGWAVDYETEAAAQSAALRECGAGCSLVLTFGRCGAYAADQEADSTAVGWAESYASANDARQAALAECRSRGGSGCAVRVWGCNGQVVEEALGLDRAARRRIQEGCGSLASTLATLTACSVRGRGRRFGGGSWRGGRGRRGIWTGNGKLKRDPCGHVKRDPPVTRTVARVGAGYGPVELRATGSVNTSIGDCLLP